MHTLLRSFVLLAGLVIGSIPLALAGDVVNVNVGLHQAELITLPRDMTRVVIADRSVAGVVKHSSRKVSVIGHGLGKTDIRFLDANKRIVRQVNLSVSHDVPGIRKAISSLFPNENIQVEVVNESVALSGSVSDAETAAHIVKVVQEFVKQDGDVVDVNNRVLNLMKIASGQQVMLRVRVGELKRDALKRFGLGAHGIITGGNAIIGLLDQEGVFKTLAEPNLVAISGETAEFLAGGEFPVPIRQQGEAMSVEYKPFGVGVKFTPYVLKPNRIRLVVSSEVSDIKQAATYTAGMYQVPSIATRRAQTTVELAPGEAFMIAGLLKDGSTASISQIPGLAEIPVLSALFRSTAYQRKETELVIAVTPYLVDPMAAKDVKLPTDNFRTPSSMDMMFFGALSAVTEEPQAAPAGGLEGDAGFMLQ